MSDRDRDDLSLDEVHATEPDPFTDRQNLEPEPSYGDVEDRARARDPDYVDGDVRSDIEEFAPEDVDDVPGQDEPRTHDDDDPWGDGVSETPLTRRYEDMADRDELARRLEDLVADADDWMQRAEDDDAREIYETLADVAERLGNPSERTTRTEATEPPMERDTADESDLNQ